MARLIEQGKVRYLASASEARDDSPRPRHPSITAVQTEYSLLYRTERGDAGRHARSRISFVAYAPLGRGLLTGTVTPGDVPKAIAAAPSALPGRNSSRTSSWCDVSRPSRARRAARRPARARVAVGAGPDVVPIPGTKRRSRLEENSAPST